MKIKSRIKRYENVQDADDAASRYAEEGYHIQSMQTYTVNGFVRLVVAYSNHITEQAKQETRSEGMTAEQIKQQIDAAIRNTPM